MKICLLLILIMCLPFTGWAHEPCEAFFTIKTNQDVIEIEAEFPWTMRNALFKFAPELKDSKSKKDFEMVLFEYVKINLLLIAKNGNSLELLSILELPQSDHTHQNNFLITYEADSLDQLQNTILCDLYSNQKNYHFLKTKRGKYEFVTRLESPVHKMKFSAAATSSFSLILALSFFMIILAALFYSKTALLKKKK